jgi:hypothetical protein
VTDDRVRKLRGWVGRTSTSGSHGEVCTVWGGGRVVVFPEEKICNTAARRSRPRLIVGLYDF